MDDPQNTNLFQSIVNNAPLSVSITHCAFISGLLTWLGILTPLIGFISVILGCIVGYYSLRVQYRKWKNVQHSDELKKSIILHDKKRKNRDDSHS